MTTAGQVFSFFLIFYYKLNEVIKTGVSESWFSVYYGNFLELDLFHLNPP